MFLVWLLLACRQGDIGIIKVYEEEGADSGVVEDKLDPWVEPTSEPTGEPSSEMTDLTIGYGEIHFKQIACPACVGVYNEFDISATLDLHQPTSGDYNEWLTPVGTCTTNLIESYVSSQPLATTSPAYFNDIALQPAGQGEWYTNSIYEYQYQRNTSYNVTSEHGTIQSAFRTVEGFDSIEPYTMLWVDPSYAFEAAVRRSGFTITWAPVRQTSRMMITLGVYSGDGAYLLGQVSCFGADNGAMFIPSQYLNYPTWSLVAIHIERFETDVVETSINNSYIETLQIWEVVGTGHIE